MRDDVSSVESSFDGACCSACWKLTELMDSVNKQCVLCHIEVLQLHKQPSFIKQIILTKPVTFCTSV